MKILSILIAFLPLTAFTQETSVFLSSGFLTKSEFSANIRGSSESVHLAIGYSYCKHRNFGWRGGFDYFLAKNKIPNNIFSSTIRRQLRIEPSYKVHGLLLHAGPELRVLTKKNFVFNLHAGLAIAYMNYREQVSSKIVNAEQELLVHNIDYYNFKPKLVPLKIIGFSFGKKVTPKLEVNCGFKFVTSFSKTEPFELRNRIEQPLSFFSNAVEIGRLADQREIIGDLVSPKYFTMSVTFRYSLTSFPNL